MATPLQQQALLRKIIYLACIVVLFTVAWWFRHKVVERQANDLSLREENVGEVELTGSVMRLSLTGMRGLAVSILWMNAIEKQKKNQWEEFDLLATSVTKLQPHFITPWLFQSWNISYNISVQCDVMRDKYYYIARGLELLQEGDKRNRHQPDMRDAMGTYYQSKICISDHQVTLQSLFQMSSVPPRERARERFYKVDSQGREYLDLEEFEQFCRDHPRLVRRLAEKPRRGEREAQLRLRTPADVVQFLHDNYKIPSLYEASRDNTKDVLKEVVEKRFPILPPDRTPPDPQKIFDQNELTWRSPLGDDFDAFAAARTWFGYAQEPLPLPDRNMPAKDGAIIDPRVQRRPKYTTVIFRTKPARAQSYVAERLQDEGWFDEPWKIKGWFPDDRFQNGEPAAVGGDRLFVGAVWRAAYDKWSRFGTDTQLKLLPEEEANWKRLAQKYSDAHGRKMDEPTLPNVRADLRGDPEIVEGRAAHERLHAYDLWRGQTNFPHFYHQSETLQKPETVTARKAMFEAEKLRKSGSFQWQEKYESALLLWKKVLDDNEHYRRDEHQQEETYEAQYNFLREWLRTKRGKDLQKHFLAQAVLGQSAGVPLPGANWLAIRQFANSDEVIAPFAEWEFDWKDPTGVPYVPTSVRKTFLSRKGLIVENAPPPGASGGPPTPPVPPPGGPPRQ